METTFDKYTLSIWDLAENPPRLVGTTVFGASNRAEAENLLEVYRKGLVGDRAAVIHKVSDGWRDLPYPPARITMAPAPAPEPERVTPRFVIEPPVVKEFTGRFVVERPEPELKR